MQKRTMRSLLPAALLAASAHAQSSTITSTIPVCPTAASITITLPTTVTFCPGPHCNGGGSGPQITAAPMNGVGKPGVNVGQYTSVGPDGKTTVLGIWETVYNSMCETGLVPATYIITQECPCEATPHPTALPTGFETTVIPCSVCAHPTVTLTQPCPTGPYASQTPSVGKPPAMLMPMPIAPAQGSPAAMMPAPGMPAAGASAGAGSGAGASAQAGPNGASASAGSGAGASAQVKPAPGAGTVSPASASAGAGSGAGASAQAGPNGASANAGSGSGANAQAAGPGGATANAGAGAGASAQAGTGATGTDVMGVTPNAGTAANGTMPGMPGMSTTNTTMTPSMTPVQSFSSAGQVSLAGFTLFAAFVASLLL